MMAEGNSQLFEDLSLLESRHETPTCSICTDALGTWGGPASLPCGHNACLDCLQKVQSHSSLSLCPFCRTPFDSKQTLCLNSDLRDTLHRASSFKTESDCVQGENERLVAVCSAHEALNEKSNGRKFFVYEVPLPEETGAWIPVSVPPTDHAEQLEAANYEGDFFPEECTWVGPPIDNRSIAPELTAWSILIEVIAFLCGARNPKGRLKKAIGGGHHDGYTAPMYRDEWDDHFDPLASSLTHQMQDDVRTMSAVLASEPPQWLPDSTASVCMRCRVRFHPITCSRHHCRFCGGIFCGPCTAQRTLLPVKFREKCPQRVCDSCFERLAPVQGILFERVSNAAQLATHDVTDLSCMRAWINSPLGLTLEHEIYKATNTLRGFSEVGHLKPERAIPDAILKGAKGLAIFTVLKAGMMVTYKVGTGLVVAKQPDGSWSAPSAIISCGIGWGPQAGGEITDFMIVLRNEAAVRAFSGRVHISLGAGLSVAAGPVGRSFEADFRTGDGGTAACYTYSLSKGLFAGCSLEGDVVMTRTGTNVQFYGDPSVSAAEILLGSMKQPKAAAPLYAALSDLFMKVHG